MVLLIILFISANDIDIFLMAFGVLGHFLNFSVFNLHISRVVQKDLYLVLKKFWMSLMKGKRTVM